MLPNDPMILLSYINTKLRDEYDTLEALCEGLDTDVEKLKERLGRAGFFYSREQNRFM